MERDQFDIEGVTLSVARSGHGQPFLFQHGLCGAADQPADVFPGDLDYQCVTLECRGHGLSDFGKASDLSLARFAHDLEVFVDSLKIGPLPIGGISMGAALSARLAVLRPDLVSALVIARPAWIDAMAPDNLAAIRAVAQHLAQFEPREAQERFEQSPLAANLAREAPDNLASLLGFFRREPIAQTQALLEAISRDGPGITQSDLAEIRCPVMVIGTACDAVHPLQMAKKLAELMPNARLVEITSKADSMARYRAEFEGALRRFIEETQS
ncbi:MAG: alpha/beta fold hydrolase [Pseudomonadota bacterium]